jgi:hypothetical protein
MTVDDWRWHAYDTIKGSDWLGDQDAIQHMCRWVRWLVLCCGVVRAAGCLIRGSVHSISLTDSLTARQTATPLL